MRCRVCGATLQEIRTDLPFKVTERTIVIVKGMPVYQCARCSEYSIADPIFQVVEEMLLRADPNAELEIVRFAA